MTLALPIVNNSAMSTGTPLILFHIFTDLLKILYFDPIHSLPRAFQDPSLPHQPNFVFSLPPNICCLVLLGYGLPL